MFFARRFFASRPMSAFVASRPLFRFSVASQVVAQGVVSRSISSRAGLFRVLFIIGGAHIAVTYGSGLLQEKQVMMSVNDYLTNEFLKEESEFKIFGVLKPGSTKLVRGSLETRFIITDFTEEIEVFYKGLTKFEFKEGETIVLTGYCPDLNQRNKVVAIDYLTKHSMEVQDWQSQSGKSRDNYGIYKQENSVV